MANSDFCGPMPPTLCAELAGIRMARSLRLFKSSAPVSEADLEGSGIWSEPDPGQAENHFTNVQLLWCVCASLPTSPSPSPSPLPPLPPLLHSRLTLSPFVLCCPRSGHTDIVRILVHVDGARVATAGDDSVAIIWHTDTVRQAGILKGHTRAITSMVVVPSSTASCADGDRGGPGLCNSNGITPRIITGSVDKTIKVWSIEECTILASLTESNHAILCLLPLQGSLFCSAGNGICVWTTAGEMITKYSFPAEDAEDIQDVILVSRSRIVATSNDKKLLVYDIEGMELVDGSTNGSGGDERGGNGSGGRSSSSSSSTVALTG